MTEKTGTHYKLISLSSYVATLMPGEWVKILREFQTVPQFLLDCLSKTSLKSVSNGDAEEMIGMVDKLVARAGGEDFFNRTEIEGQLDRLKGKSKPKSFLSVLKKNLL